ncbi:hypothetical protein AB0G54_36975 [Streptomyces yokosukanensis]|uniref:hypothetical protein n=1 Tax=Streptomyces yokosukanensis TaxID=67386 RepID=UPI00342CB812
MSDPAERQEVARDYLTEGGDDLKGGKRAFLSLDLGNGRLRAYASTEYADVAPVLVGACWHMRWPIPPLDNDSANRLMNAVADSAGSLFWQSDVRGENDPLGVILHGGAGTAIDAIQRECAEAWRTHYEVQK